MRSTCILLFTFCLSATSCKKSVREPLTVTQPDDFRWSATMPEWKNQKTTDTVIYNLETEYIDGKLHEVVWSADSLPSNILIRFAPTNGKPPFKTVMTVISSNAAKGTYQVKLTSNAPEAQKSMSRISPLIIE